MIDFQVVGPSSSASGEAARAQYFSVGTPVMDDKGRAGKIHAIKNGEYRVKYNHIKHIYAYGNVSKLGLIVESFGGFKRGDKVRDSEGHQGTVSLVADNGWAIVYQGVMRGGDNPVKISDLKKIDEIK
jgi:hypothetical protein